MCARWSRPLVQKQKGYDVLLCRFGKNKIKRLWSFPSVFLWWNLCGAKGRMSFNSCAIMVTCTKTNKRAHLDLKKKNDDDRPIIVVWVKFYGLKIYHYYPPNWNNVIINMLKSQICHYISLHCIFLYFSWTKLSLICYLHPLHSSSSHDRAWRRWRSALLFQWRCGWQRRLSSAA